MRTFIGIDVNRRVMELVEELTNSLVRMGFKGNWVKPENVHMTMVFLGELAEKKVEEIAQHLSKRLRGFPSFSFMVKGMGYFKGKNGMPRVLWLGVEAPEALYKLYDEIVAELKQHSVTFDENKFKPHITLCRLKWVPQYWEKLLNDVNFEDEIVVVDDVKIYSSILTPRGPIYNVEYVCDFEGGLITNG
ncbi:MAG: RNA 2',3'-cyclic phosphodiesterase [Thermotogae bacterium]|nr:RNA 2',3'-cyclic phosphodiesterase [Thermotogota bacterium]